ncbi:BCAS2 pre-mRNA processing factor [Arctopsyche grandis]|uniref:BCAS2 pre-mRNA processing factor n=1 Tax=Arctopsyche grandis TaxID=121162 RepID=UPI00406D8DA2
MAGEVIVDALPYIDQGYDDPGVREAAMAMVEEECRRYRPTKNYLEQLPSSSLITSSITFETPMLKRELERLNSRLPPEPLSMKRYELPPPPPGRLSDPTAWVEAVDNSLAQLEHQATRVINLELQLEYSCETWKAYLDVLSKMVTGAQTRLSAVRKETAAVNWERKSVQTAMGSKLRGLEQEWVQLVSHNYRIERAIAELEADLVEAQSLNAQEKEQEDEVKPIDNEISENGVETEPTTEEKENEDEAKEQAQNSEPEENEETPPAKKSKVDQTEDIFAA